MFRARVCLLGLVLALTSLLLAKDEPGIVMLWPSQDNASLKLTFSRFRNVGGYEGKMSLVSDVVIENLSSKVIPQASFNVFPARQGPCAYRNRSIGRQRREPR